MLNSSTIKIGGNSPNDYFLMEHDSLYATGLCFHMLFSWIFAPGPKMLEQILKPLFRMIRQFKNGYFKILPFSERIRNQELVPFEQNSTYRKPF
jgi:hypothetical protein